MILVKWAKTMRDKQAEGGSYSANYSMGQFSVGYGETLHAPAQKMNTASTTAKIQHYENEAYSIGFAVNENMSISFTEETSTQKNNTTKAAGKYSKTRSDVEMEITTIDVSYTVGGATLGLSNSEHSNDSYTSGDDTTETIVAISLAF